MHLNGYVTPEAASQRDGNVTDVKIVRMDQTKKIVVGT